MTQKQCTRRTLFFLIAALAITALANITIAAQNDRQAETALQRALNKEFIDGDIEGAIKQYKDVVSRYGGSRGIATKALLRLGQAYERLGNEEAQKAYKRVVSDYSDQREAVAEALARLKAFPNVSSALSFAPRGLTRICSEGCSWAAVTPDGRYLVGFLNYLDHRDLRDLITGEERSVTGSFRQGTTFTADGKQMAYATLQGPSGQMIRPGFADEYGKVSSHIDKS
jgi:tetratricopeptide (TPR) repeat protein